MEEKRKRGRPRKVKPEEQVEKPIIVEQVATVEEPIIIPKEQTKQVSEWDFKIGDTIEYFDKDKSYELTGYKPINKYKGLDFNPEWFIEARETYKRDGHYCRFRYGQKAYKTFWNEEYRRCREGYTVNGYTITGDHYFFLNYYTLNNTTKNVKAMDAVEKDFPNFIVSQYEYFHYL